MALSRELENARTPDNNPSPDLAGAPRWALAAGAEAEAARLRARLGEQPVEVPALDSPPAEIKPLGLRAELLAQRPGQTSTSMASQDADVHRQVAQEAQPTKSSALSHP